MANQAKKLKTMQVRLLQKQTRAKKRIDNFNKLYSFQTIFPSGDSLCTKCIQRLFDHFLMSIDRTLDVYLYF